MRNLVIINQAVNYLTIGLANAFSEKLDNVSLITGSIHIQGEELNGRINVKKIIRWREYPALKKILSYLIGTVQVYFLLLTKFSKHEVLFVSIPPWGYLLNLVLVNRFSMLIWDVYPDILKITGISESNPIYKSWAFLNKKSFKKAFRIITIGSKTSDLLGQYTDRTRVINTPIWSIFNGNEKKIKDENYFIKEHKLDGKFIVQYSGNIGLTHNVELIITMAEKLNDIPDIIFQIIGRGPRLAYIKNLVKSKSLSNCQFLPFQSDEMFPYSLSAASVGIVVLDERVAKGSVPSKTYNLMSFGIPSLYIASRESELFDYAQKYGNAECYSANEIDKAVNFIKMLFADNVKYLQYSSKAFEASKYFQRSNADKIVDFYLKD